MSETKEQIPRSMIQLAHENGAEIEFEFSDSEGVWNETRTAKHKSLDCYLEYRIANKTSDGLRLDELLEQADWKLENILVSGKSMVELDDRMSDCHEMLYWVCRNNHCIENYSLKKQAPTMRDMTAQEIAMLPRGTAFVRAAGDKVWNPYINISPSEGVLLNDDIIVNNMKGYILPNETEIREFKVEV